MTPWKHLPLFAFLILSFAAYSSAQTVTSATFNANDQPSSETYDSNGNTLTTGGNSYIYDSENHLIGMNGGAVKLTYDGDGNLVSKTAHGVTTQYLVDDMNPTRLPQVVEESVNGAVLRRYTIGLQRISQTLNINGVLTTSYYGYDGQGNVRQLTNAAGAVTDTFDYDSFGNLIGHTGTTPNHFLYRGELYDTDLNLYYLRARWYNPLTGRFMSRDPEDGSPTDPASLHKYLYAAGDPVNNTDPTGRATMPLPFPVPAPASNTVSAGGDLAEYGMLVGVVALGTVAADKKLACSISTSLASEAMELMGGTAIPDESHCTAKCGPCNPPPNAGTECHQPDLHESGSDHYGWTQHYHLWSRNQNPSTCKCYWNITNGPKGTTGTIPSNMDDCNTFPSWPAN